MKYKIIPWLAVSAFVLFQFTFQLSSGSLIQALMNDFKIQAATAGILAGSYYYIYAVLQIPSGFLFDRFNARYILSLGAAFAGLGCLLFALSTKLATALIGRMIFGGGAAVAFVGLLYVTRMNFPFRLYAFLIGLSETFGLICSLITTVVFAYIIHTLGWRFCFYIGAAIGFVLALLIYRYIPNSGSSQQFDFVNFKWQLKQVLKNKVVWLNGLYISIGFSMITVFAALWSTPFLMTKLSISLLLASKLSGFCFLGAAMGCPLFGFLGSAVNNRSLLLFIANIVTAIIVSLVIYHPSHNYAFYCLLMFLLGLSCTSYMIAFTISDEISSPNIKNTMAGFTNTLAILSAPLLQPLIGSILDYHHQPHHSYTLVDYQHALALIPILSCLNCILIFYLPQKKNQPEEYNPIAQQAHSDGLI